MKQKLKELETDFSLETTYSDMKKEINIRIRKIKIKMAELSQAISKKENAFSHFCRWLHFISKYIEFANEPDYSEEELNSLRQDLIDYSLAYLQNYSKALSQDQVVNVCTINEICKAIWSLCTISQYPSQIKHHYKILMKILIEFQFSNTDLSKKPISSQQKFLDESEVQQIYQSYLYMKEVVILPQDFINNLQRSHTENSLKSLKDISMLHLDIVKVLEKAKISYKIEEKLNGLDVDVILGDQFNEYQIVIDVHGYQHYFRNIERLKGHNILKRKIIKNFGYEYFEIPIFVWHSLLDDKLKLKYINEGVSNLLLNKQF